MVHAPFNLFFFGGGGGEITNPPENLVTHSPAICDSIADIHHLENVDAIGIGIPYSAMGGRNVGSLSRKFMQSTINYSWTI